MSIEAMKLALEALDSDNPDIQLRAAIALRQALETEQEPVISTDHGPWIPSTHPGEEGETYCKRCLLRDKFFGSRQCDPHIVYTAPPHRKPLTEEHIIGLWQHTKEPDGHRIERFARAIEAAHGITGEIK